MKKFANNKNNAVTLCLRVGLAIAFLYAAVASFRNPEAWAAYLPSILTDHFQADMLLKFFSVYELVLVVWLLSGWYIRYVGVLCMLTLVGIVVSNPHALDLMFRDLALAFSGLALAFTKD